MGPGRLLIVDDERFHRDLFRDVLGAQGHSVGVAESGEEALAMIQQEPIDIVITDLIMKGMDGLSFIEKLQQVNADIQCIMVTGKDDVRLAVRAMKAGCADFLTKPVEKEELITVVERVLERARVQLEHRKLLSENMQFLRAQALFRQCLEILAILDLERLQEHVLSVLAKVTDAQGGAIWIADERGQLFLRGYRGLVDRATLPSQIDSNQDAITGATGTGLPFAAPGMDLKDAFYVPLVADKELLALALLTDRASGSFGEEERATARALADFAAIAVKNARRFQALERVGLRDRETGAYHLAYFVDYAGKEFYKARRYGRSFALVVFSIDNLVDLKKVAGYEICQRGIRSLIGSLSKIARDADIVAKVAENEFYLLLPETDYFGALMFLRRAAELTRAQPSVRELEAVKPILVSAGAACFPKDGEDFDELLHTCRLRIEEQRCSMVRRHHLHSLEKGSFWELADFLLGAAGQEPALPESSHSALLPADPDLFSATQQEAAREIGRDIKARAVLYVGLRDRMADAPLLTALEHSESAARIFLLGARGDGTDPVAHPSVTSLFLDGDARIAEHEFLLYLSEHSAYGLIQRPQGRLFHTSDAPLVQMMITHLQAQYDLQPY